ncbi:hypothetical protein ACJX0J_008711 [Zea mays]
MNTGWSMVVLFFVILIATLDGNIVLMILVNIKTTSYPPQSKGMAKRKKGTLIDLVNAMFFHQNPTLGFLATHRLLMDATFFKDIYQDDYFPIYYNLAIVHPKAIFMQEISKLYKI